MEDNFTNKPEQDNLDMLRHYQINNKLAQGFLPFITYDMVQCGYPRPTHGEMIPRLYGGSNGKGELLPSKGMWCKVEDAVSLNSDLLAALELLLKEADALMDHCVDRGFIDTEDESVDGVNDFNAAIAQAKAAIKKAQGKEEVTNG